MLDQKMISSMALRNFFPVVLAGLCFLIFGASVSVAALPTPTPKKTAPAATPAAKAAATRVIVSVTSARVRSAATTSSAEVKRMKLGTVLPVLEKTTGKAFWYKVQLTAGSKPATGWMSSTVVDSFEAGKAETKYRELTAKNFKKEKMSFTDASEVYEFLNRVAPEVKTRTIAAELNLRKYQSLAAALEFIPIERTESNPYKAFTNTHDKNIVYSEPAGMWFIRPEHLWDLNKKYADTIYGEEMAWTAAITPMAGECEGYVNCYLYRIKSTWGEYLVRYPDSKNAVESLKNISAFLDPVVDDLKEKQVYTGPTDITDRAEYNRLLVDLRNIISRLPLIEKDRALRQIGLLAEAYK